MATEKKVKLKEGDNDPNQHFHMICDEYTFYFSISY
jgi:hypothetical protein